MMVLIVSKSTKNNDGARVEAMRDFCFYNKITEYAKKGMHLWTSFFNIRRRAGHIDRIFKPLYKPYHI